jgi:hypothetical protein
LKRHSLVINNFFLIFLGFRRLLYNPYALETDTNNKI